MSRLMPRSVVVELVRQEIFPSRGSSLGAVRGFVHRCAEDLHLARTDEQDIVLAASEAAANAIIHGSGPELTVSCRSEDGWLAVEVENEGAMEPPPAPEALDVTHGRGVQIMLALVDEVTIRTGDGGHPTTFVRLRKRLERPSVLLRWTWQPA
jgi:anti-sigma regulatory factor (Ser/Thr protein kinase)